jgi:hypothetical protein
MKFRVFWDIAPCSDVEVDRRFRGAYCLNHQGDVLMMEAVRTSETSVNFNVTTRRYIPEDSELPQLKSKNINNFLEIVSPCNHHTTVNCFYYYSCYPADVCGLSIKLNIFIGITFFQYPISACSLIIQA